VSNPKVRPLRAYCGVGDGDGDDSSPVAVEAFVSVDPLVLEEAPVSVGDAALGFVRAPSALIFWIASSRRCLIARISAIFFSLLALRSVLSGGAKPGGIDAEG